MAKDTLLTGAAVGPHMVFLQDGAARCYVVERETKMHYIVRPVERIAAGGAAPIEEGGEARYVVGAGMAKVNKGNMCFSGQHRTALRSTYDEMQKSLTRQAEWVTAQAELRHARGVERWERLEAKWAELTKREDFHFRFDSQNVARMEWEVTEGRYRGKVYYTVGFRPSGKGGKNYSLAAHGAFLFVGQRERSDGDLDDMPYEYLTTGATQVAYTPADLGGERPLSLHVMAQLYTMFSV